MHDVTKTKGAVYERILLHVPAPRGISIGRVLRMARKFILWKRPGLLGALPCLQLSRGRRFPPVDLKYSSDVCNWPILDISVVSYNNAEWISGFLESLAQQDYPLDRIRLLVCDHSPNGELLLDWESHLKGLRHEFCEIVLTGKDNRGFGAGHNTNLNASNSILFFVTNLDIEFRKKTLQNVVATALFDLPAIVAWECRQVPYEHPKYYSPRTLETHWCSAAACLYRAEAFREVGGFDENIFMYGEDVEISFAFRAKGFGLRYVPSATIVHHSYNSVVGSAEKTHQTRGTAFSYIYIARAYGSVRSVAKIIPFVVGASFWPRLSWGRLVEIFSGVWRALRTKSPRKVSSRVFRPYFGKLEFEISRTSPGVAAPTVERKAHPLVSIIVRTFGERKEWACEALRTISYQTYRQVEVILVEDGTDKAEALLTDLQQCGIPTHYIGTPRRGRCYAGNVGLAHASGDLLMFLDDDDGFFADHVETLVDLAVRFPRAPLVYSSAIKVFTHLTSLKPLVYEERAFAPGHGNNVPFDRNIMRIRNLIPIQAALFRRSAYEMHGGFNTDLDYWEDWDLWLRLMRTGDFVKSERVTSFYRVPDDFVLLQERALKHRRKTSRRTRFIRPGNDDGL